MFLLFIIRCISNEKNKEQLKIVIKDTVENDTDIAKKNKISPSPKELLSVFLSLNLVYKNTTKSNIETKIKFNNTEVKNNSRRVSKKNNKPAQKPIKGNKNQYTWRSFIS